MFWVLIRQHFGAGGKHTVSDTVFYQRRPCIMQGQIRPNLSDFKTAPLLHPYNMLILHDLYNGIVIAVYIGIRSDLMGSGI